jgi:hypothetical protein
MKMTTKAAAVIGLLAVSGNALAQEAASAESAEDVALVCRSSDGSEDTHLVNQSGSTVDGDPALFTRSEIMVVGLLRGGPTLFLFDRYTLGRRFYMRDFEPGERERLVARLREIESPQERSEFVRSLHGTIREGHNRRWQQLGVDGEARTYLATCRLQRRSL